MNTQKQGRFCLGVRFCRQLESQAYLAWFDDDRFVLGLRGQSVECSRAEANWLADKLSELLEAGARDSFEARSMRKEGRHCEKQ
jgi:hypothetical protein